MAEQQGDISRMVSGDAPTDPSLSFPPPSLRRDLIQLRPTRDRGSRRIIFDEISGKFSRLSESLWQTLADQASDQQTSKQHQPDWDQTLWDQAVAAGWTRQRVGKRPKIFSPFYFRIPVFHADRLASFAARYSGPLFARTAIALWLAIGLFATLVIIGNFQRLTTSMAKLPAFYQQTHPAILAMVFGATKLIHELSHAVACRRAGAPCGKIGILMLCGMPCPYCDVTQVWRLASPLRRAAVMAAGIYVELILASLAVLVWWSTDRLGTQLHAINVLLVCGVSSILFNANPLMRYDGYYLLSDMIGSVNLRHQSRLAFDAIFHRIMTSSQSTIRHIPLRQQLFAIYHLASAGYRLFVLVVIGTLFFTIAQWFSMQRVAGLMLIGIAILWMLQIAKRGYRIMLGRGQWKDVTVRKRMFVLGCAGVFLAAIVWVPLPRQSVAHGVVDAANSTSVFLPVNGVVHEVASQFGQRVRRGQQLVTIRNDQDLAEATRLKGKIRVASLRSLDARRETLKDDSAQDQWKSALAVEQALRDRYASVTKQVDQAIVCAPLAGTVIPTAAPTTNIRHWPHPGSHVSLALRSGSKSQTGLPWCRISAGHDLYAVLNIDAVHRQHLHVGDSLRIMQEMVPDQVVQGKVVSISAIRDEKQLVTRDASFEVLCELPRQSDLKAEEFVSRIGGTCRAVIDLPARRVWDELIDGLGELIR